MNRQKVILLNFCVVLFFLSLARPADAALSISCFASPNPADINQLVLFSSNVSDGTGDYVYNWSIACSGDSSSCQQSFPSSGTYTAYLTVTSGGESQTTACTAVVQQICASHDHKACCGNNLYWYDSCGNKEDMFQDCGAAGCSNAACLPPPCISHDHKACVGSSVYWFDSCGNQQEIFQACASNQTCQSGQCVSVVCSSNSDCGTDGYIDGTFCQGGDVYQTYKTYTCNNAGTAYSSCSNSTSARLVQDCGLNQTCSNGSCGSNCAYHSYQQCSGNNLYWYDSCGNQQDLIQYCPNGCSGNSCNSQQYITVQTNSATNISSNQATLNGYLSGYNSYNNNNYVWFQWGTTASYGYETNRQNFYGSNSFSFSQNIVNLQPNTTYHFRAVAQSYSGNLVYGQDMTFFTSYGYGNYLTITKTARNLTSGNTGWSSAVYANPSDVLMFMITIQANSNQNVDNVFVRDIFPANLIYRNQLVVSGSNYYNNYSGDITSGINLGTISSGQTVTITYQAQLASAANFSYGTSTLTNNVYITSSGSNYNNNVSNATIYVTRTGVLGASFISTGLTNNFWVDSFFLPLAIALFGLLLWRFGAFVGIEKWLDAGRAKQRDYKAEKQLKSAIGRIQKSEFKN